MLTINKAVYVEPGQMTYIIPISDIHYNSVDCDKDRFHGLFAWAQRKEEEEGSHVLFFGTGDYNELPSPSERAAFAAAKQGFGMHETTLEAYDELVLNASDHFYHAVEPMAHAFIGLGEGHHYWDKFASDSHNGVNLRGRTSTQYLCEMIGCEYLGDISIINLLFRVENLHVELPFSIMAMHGYGSARTAGAQINKRLRMAEVMEGCDLYVMGHDNLKAVFPRSPLCLNPHSPDGVSYHKQYFIGAGSFQRGYRMGTPFGNYVEKLALPPSQLGVNIAMLKVEERDGTYRLDYHVSS